MPYQIAVVDDEVDFSDALAEYLSRLGHEVVTAENGAALEALMQRRRLDLVLLDLRLGRESGHDILTRIAAGNGPPVILVSGHAGLLDRVALLEAGAEDVVAKPIDPRELAARVEAVLRARRPESAGLLRFEAATADLGAARLIHDDGRIERLDAGEVALLRTFRAMAGRLLSRAELLEQAPANSDDALERAIDNRVSRLRAKIGTAAIVTVRGAGYRFDPVEPAPHSG